jgi:hypothetical protein
MSERDVTVYSDSIRTAIENLPEDLIYLTEESLRKQFNPSIKHYEVKRAFWDELVLAQDRKATMRTWRIYDGKFSKAHFYNNLVKNQLFMAWVITPLVSYEDKTKAALDKVTERYDELINMEITSVKRVKDKDGEYKLIEETDPKKALVLLSVIKNLEDRIKGTSIQRAVQISADKPSGQGSETASLSMEAVNEKLKELTDKLNPYEERVENEDDTSGSGSSRDDTSGGILARATRHIDVESDGAGGVHEVSGRETGEHKQSKKVD